ncbi:hypothetical protein T4C_10625 [Trichinella pseudospiralis]|uniref:Uncharacterized protein n=1 Tax=Trichinella pseudospiralis TaxID=6337 RepID=A0A0V1GLV5_TRIPS|nr:hypothetical protein T4C_10625 [Trichinella pseudospiralis]
MFTIKSKGTANISIFKEIDWENCLSYLPIKAKKPLTFPTSK